MLKFHTGKFLYNYKSSLLIIYYYKEFCTLKFRTFLVVRKLIQVENFPNYGIYIHAYIVSHIGASCVGCS